MAKKKRKRRLKKWVKTVLAFIGIGTAAGAGFTVYRIYANAAMDTEYRFVYEKPLLHVEETIRYDMEGGIFYRQTDKETRTAVMAKALVVSEDGETFHEIRTDDTGKLITGWYEGKDGKYYYSKDHGWLVTESSEIEGQFYTLDENGRVLDDEWVKEGNGNVWYDDGQKTGLEEDSLLFIEGESGFYYLSSSNGNARVENTEVSLPDGRLLIYDENGNIVNERSTDAEGRVYFPIPESYETAAETKLIAVSEFISETEETGMRYVNHRGYHVEAPENSLAAYMQSYEQGYHYVECDIQMTADGIPVLLHNETINAVARNSDGSPIGSQVYIDSLTLEQADAYDFGIMCGQNYAGTKITRLDEFLSYCKAYNIHPYLEMKGETVDTQEECDLLLSMVQSYGMQDQCTWISFASSPLQFILNQDPDARIGYLISAKSALDQTASAVISQRQQGYNVFVDAVFTAADAIASKCEANDVPLEVWTVNNDNYLSSLNPYISAITTDYLK